MAVLTLDAPESRLAVDWEPVNWFSATWRNCAPLERRPARAFDTAAAKANFDPFVVEWGKAPADLQLSTEEALFWFASCFGKGLGDCSKLAELTATAQSGQGKFSLEAMNAALTKSRFDNERAHGLVPMQVLSKLMSDEDLVALLCQRDTMPTVLSAYRKRVLPFLSAEKKHLVKRVVADHIIDAKWDSNRNFAFYLAACLGMHEVTELLVGSWKDSYGVQCDTRYKALQLIVFGLSSADAMVENFKRLNLRLVDAEQVICWVAHTIDSELSVVSNSLGKTSAADSLGMLKVVSQIQTAPAAIFMFDRLNEQWAAQVASQWLTAHTDLTVEALIEIASRPGKRADDALAYLRTLAKKEGYTLVNEVASRMSPAVVRRVKEELLEPGGSELPEFDNETTPDWLALEMASASQNPIKKKMPAWLELSDLPPIIINGFKLNQEQLTILIGAFQRSTLEAPPTLAAKLKTHGDEGNLDRFAWLLFDLWLREGGSSKENWALITVAFIGSDVLATRLAQQIKVWPGESNHKRAVLGLECLRTMGTDNALMQINAIAEKVQFKGLKGKATECIAAIAETRGLSHERLGDRIIPSLGFTRTGERIFDFGPRNFIVTIGDDLKPIVVDQQGKLRTELPVPSPSDDQELAVESAAEWKLLKKALRDLYSLQSVRLEHSMILGRRWFADEFSNFLLNHPLMPVLLKQFVWGGFDMFGKLKASFMMLSKSELRTMGGESVAISDFSEIGLLHPLQLDESEVTQWKTKFVELGMSQVFPQLQRPVHMVHDNETHDVEILRVRNYQVPALYIIGVLEKRGWQRGPVGEGGLFTEHTKYFSSADITAVIQYQGIIVGDPAHSDSQYVDYCAVLPGKIAGETEREFQKGLALGTVERAVMSEILMDVELLRSKGELDPKLS
jgi:hypothetical protein